MKKYLFICFLFSHLTYQEGQSKEEEALIVDGGQAGNYDRPYSLNPIPIHPRAQEPSSCDDQEVNKESDTSASKATPIKRNFSKDDLCMQES